MPVVLYGMAPSTDALTIVNIDDEQWTDEDDTSRSKQLGRLAGGSDIGCTYKEVQPGAKTSRFHYHLGNEEALFVISGRGSMQTTSGLTEVQGGDYVAFPRGEEGAHTVENTSDEVLRCLFFSTMNEPEVVGYPEEGMLGIIAGAAPGEPPEDRFFMAHVEYSPTE